MSSSAPTSPLRQILETRIAQLSSEMEGLFAEARERGRRESADQLNQAVRRLRQSPDLEELRAILTDTAAGFASGTALFRIEEQKAMGERIRGVTREASTEFEGLNLGLETAAALASAVVTRDPVTALASAAEVTPEVVRLAGLNGDGRVFLYPLVVHDNVPAVLMAWGLAQESSLELLSQVAAAVWSELAKPPEPPPPPPEPAPDLVTIAAASPRVTPGRDWDQFTPAEQQIHLRAQRQARVQVAEMRLHHAEAVQSGRARRDLFGALRDPISAARLKFRQYFLSCPSMVDYLHLEMVKTLANDDPELMGNAYPGPLTS